MTNMDKLNSMPNPRLDKIKGKWRCDFDQDHIVDTNLWDTPQNAIDGAYRMMEHYLRQEMETATQNAVKKLGW